MDIDRVGIEYLGHSGFIISCISGKKIVIDPYNVSGNVDKVDFILITHSHYDHCSIKDIEKFSKSGTVIIVPADAQSKITRIEGVNMQVIESGDELSFGNIKFEAMPAYNIDKQFHTKKDGWVGYVIKIGNVIIYHAGDSDRIPEMERLTGYGKLGNHFIALLPVSGKYVMSAEEAAEVAGLIRPEIAIPMHYGAGVAGTADDAKQFVILCKEKGIEAKILDKMCIVMQ